MPKLIESNKCCGCTACANICAKGAISMHPNEEGFIHPQIDSSLCIECGLCEKACPGLLPAKRHNNNFHPKTYIIQHRSDTIRYQSTSGGAFSAIAQEVIRRNGVVFGAVMTEDLKVQHTYVETENGLALFRNSKYVQSDIGDNFKTARNFLISNRMVCFSGTPCQINGLYKYLGRNFDNLITVDVVCKSVPSPLVFDKYVEFKKQKEKTISDIVFRDKKRGFLYCTMAHYGSHEARYNNKDQYRRGSESDEWLRLFLSGQISRTSCANCLYQADAHVSDITLGDIWETSDPSWDDDKGTTLAHVWTEKGQSIIDYINNKTTRCREYNLVVNKHININIYSNRDQLFKDVRDLSPEAFFNIYAPYNVFVKLKNYSRFILYKLHLQTFFRHIKHLIIHNR